jgi:hypothetical protein
MSLKHFHLLFIFIATLVSFFFGFWAIHGAMNRTHAGYFLLGALSLVAGICLILYSVQFLKKFKGMAIIACVSVLTMTGPASACSVCYGNPASALSKGLNMGIICLLAILSIVLGSFSWFFIQVTRRSQAGSGN